jgi:hypothetical protein
VLNPRCSPEACKMANGTEGICKRTDAGDCICDEPEDPNDPCGSVLNPRCSPEKCELANGDVGICRLNAKDDCLCVDDNPCGEALNPVCAPVTCQMSDGTRGKCQVSKDLECLCEDPGTVPEDPCGSIANPKCTADPCETTAGTPGTCEYQERMCLCLETTQDEPCSDLINPKCTPDTCETDNGLKGSCATRSVEPMGPQCLCLALPDACKEAFDCVELEWTVKCYGRWECVSGKCEPTCEQVYCGNGSCEPEFGESRTSCPTDCEDYCFKNDDCLEGSFCEYPDGQCKAPGKCQRKPVRCSDTNDPVCGCDDQTYQNSCMAGMAGVSILALGECPSPTP